MKEEGAGRAVLVPRRKRGAYRGTACAQVGRRYSTIRDMSDHDEMTDQACDAVLKRKVEEKGKPQKEGRLGVLIA